MADYDQKPSMKTPSIIRGRNESAHYWHVGEYFLTAYPAPRGWDVRIRSRSSEVTEFVIDGRFTTEADATTWCSHMAAVYAEDQSEA
jgi:hypothetical protein